MIVDKNLLIFYSSNREVFYNRVIIAKLIIDVYSSQVKVSIQVLRDKITAIKPLTIIMIL